MKGKIVNVLFGIMNISLGLLILAYAVIIPSNGINLTIQQGIVVNYINIFMSLIIISIASINFIQSYVHRNDSFFNIAYLIGAFSITFLFVKFTFIASFSIISGLIVLYKSIKENLVELNSTTGISISIVVMVAILMCFGITYKYVDIGNYIKNKENNGEIAYDQEFFKYITELDETNTPYINVKKDGKYGFISLNGNEVIPFEYEFATPFVEITSYNKRFQVALVCDENGSTQIIMKNRRVVLSYKTESRNENYDAKYEELNNVYTKTLGQSGNMHYEIEKITDNINKVPAYNVSDSVYTHKYDLNQEYDLFVIESRLGNTYELHKKENVNEKIDLKANHLDFDDDYLYLYSNGYIPFFDNTDEDSQKFQGWFTPYGVKKSLSGNVQILEFFEDKILIRDYNKGLDYFIDINSADFKPISEMYKDIFVCSNGRYIVKTENNIFKVIDESLNKVFDAEYKVINPSFVGVDLYLATDDIDAVEFNDFGYAKMNWRLLNLEGNSVYDNIEQIYNIFYKLDENDEDVNGDSYFKFQERLTNLEYKFVGDKFYNK